jgi:hypothetical protein
MNPKALLPYSISMGLLAGVVTLVTWQMSGFLVTGATPLTYVSFCAWAAYFLFGAAPKPALHALSSMAFGIIAAIAMFVLSIAFGFVPWWAVPLAVVILVILMMWLEKVPPASNIAAVFLGTGLYFSLSAAGVFQGNFSVPMYLTVGGVELLYVAIGFVAGWLSVLLGGWCTAKFAAPQAADKVKESSAV